jgi:hypothetical protein
MLQEWLRHLFPHQESKLPQECVRETREMREQLSEKQVDKTIADSFPASDPPAWY